MSSFAHRAHSGDKAPGSRNVPQCYRPSADAAIAELALIYLGDMNERTNGNMLRALFAGHTMNRYCDECRDDRCLTLPQKLQDIAVLIQDQNRWMRERVAGIDGGAT